jgi:hypothetical protein
MPDTGTLATYSLVSWVRRGMGTLVTGHPAVNFASLPVSVGVNGTGVVAPAVRLLGPGDVTGLDARAVIRTEPRDATDNFEPNYLAMVELALPDLPWMFTPSGDNGGYLQPWLCLIVVPDGPGTTLKNSNRMSVLTLDAPLDPRAELPDLKTIGFWAHAQVTGLEGGDLNAAFDGDSSATVSRLLSARRLQPNQRYIACIVPTYHAGVCAGLGETVDDADTALAWDSSVTAPFTLPVYYSFRFGTGAAGDFGSLARSIKPATQSIAATRTIDVSDPAFGIAALPGDPTLELEGALRTVNPADTTDNPSPDWPTGLQTSYLGDLTTTLNGQSQMPPVVSPPVYGSSQSAVDLFPSAPSPAPPAWLGQLNFDPRTRVAAAAGALVVQKNKDALVASAWEQVGEIRRVNRLLSQGQLAREASSSLLSRHLQTVSSEGAFLQITAPVHSRVRLASPNSTLRGDIDSSIVPNAALSSAMRKVLRARGPIGRQIQPAGQGTASIFDRLNRQPSAPGALQVAPARSAPRGMVAFDQVTAAASVPGTFQIGKMAGTFESATGVKLSSIGKGSTTVDRAATAGGLQHTPAPVAIVNPGHGPVVVSPIPVNPSLPTGTVSKLATFANWGTNLPVFLKTAGANLPAPIVLPTAPADLASMNLQFTQAAGTVINSLGTAPPAQAPAPSLPETMAPLLARLQPAVTIPARLGVRIPLNPGADKLQPLRLSPEFPSSPMYEALAELSPEWMLPGISTLAIDTATLMESNGRFIESFMIGLNEELSRELLWRQFPADTSFTYFQNFWSSTSADIPAIRTFDPGKQLGDHVSELASGNTVVLLVRANLFRRFPNAIVSLVQAKWVSGGSDSVRTLAGPFNYPNFRGEIGSDITFFGFALESLQGDPTLVPPMLPQHAADLQGSSDPAQNKPGWYVVLEEHLTEPRFGLEPDEILAQPSSGSSTQPTWDELGWPDVAPGTFLDPSTKPAKYSQLEGVTWGVDAASMAYILMREPVRVAIHALALLEPQETRSVTP